MVRLGWGNFALKQPSGVRNRRSGRRERHLSEQLNAHSEELNATMRHHGTELVAFTLTSDQLWEVVDLKTLLPFAANNVSQGLFRCLLHWGIINPARGNHEPKGYDCRWVREASPTSFSVRSCASRGCTLPFRKRFASVGRGVLDAPHREGRPPCRPWQGALSSTRRYILKQPEQLSIATSVHARANSPAMPETRRLCPRRSSVAPWAILTLPCPRQ